MKRAIVLSGGGARGAYQIGAWKALRKLNIKYDIVTGTSIGSINGLMMVQNDYYKARTLWKNISFSDIFNENISNGIEKIDLYKEIMKIFWKKGGLETNKIYNLILENFNEKKFYRSKIDYGIVTFNLKKLKPMIIKKEDKNDDLVKYILASSTCYPAFQITKIDDSMFIDGGYYDNLPINLAIEMGAEEIIAIDLDAVGIKKKIKSNNTKIIYIKPVNNLDSFLLFNKNIAARSMLYGYNDVMKKFGKLEGNFFTFYKNNLFNNYTLYYDKFTDTIISNINENKISNAILNKIKNIRILNQIITLNIYNKNNKIFNDIVEYAGKLLEIDDSEIYNIKIYNIILIKNTNKYEAYSKKYIKNIVSSKQISKIINKRALMLYIFKSLKNDDLNETEIFILSSLFTKEFLVACYLITL